MPAAILPEEYNRHASAAGAPLVVAELPVYTTVELSISPDVNPSVNASPFQLGLRAAMIASVFSLALKSFTADDQAVLLVIPEISVPYPPPCTS